MEGTSSDTGRINEEKTSTILALHSLVDYVPVDKPPSLNQSEVTLNRFNSIFYMHDVDELDVMQIVQLLSYYLRVRFDVCFDRPPQTEGEQAGYMLFYSIRDFNGYFENLREFILRMYNQNQNLATKFDLFLEEIQEDASSAKVSEETIGILQQFKNVRKVFNQFFQVFTSSNFDSGLLFEKLFLERSMSAIIPLTIPMETMGSLDTMFDQMCYLVVQSVDYSNSVMPALISSGFVVYSLLYLSGSEILSDDSNPKSWGKVNSKLDEMPKWLHAQTETEQYRQEVSLLPKELFDEAAGDVYVSKHDFIATLLAQTLNRLFTRLLEWPLREDVAKWLDEYLKCDNIHRFFNEYGRNEQMWIRFRQRKHNRPDLPTVYVKIDQLNVMFDDIALASRKTPLPTGAGANVLNILAQQNNAPGNVQLPPEKMAVRDRFESFVAFRDNYSAFMLNGFMHVKNKPQQGMFELVCRQFIQASGGFRGVDILEHSQQANHDFSLDRDLEMDVNLRGITYRGCKHCSNLLVPGTIPDVFHVDQWLKKINVQVFPYNLVSLTSANYTRELLASCAVFKMLEGFATKRLTSDRAHKIIQFFETNRAVCSFIVTQSELVSLWTRATQQLSFFKDFFENFNLDE